MNISDSNLAPPVCIEKVPCKHSVSQSRAKRIQVQPGLCSDEMRSYWPARVYSSNLNYNGLHDISPESIALAMDVGACLTVWFGQWRKSSGLLRYLLNWDIQVIMNGARHPASKKLNLYIPDASCYLAAWQEDFSIIDCQGFEMWRTIPVRSTAQGRSEAELKKQGYVRWNHL